MKPVLPDKDRLPQACGSRTAMDGSFASLDLAIPVSCPDAYVWSKTYMPSVFINEHSKKSAINT